MPVKFLTHDKILYTSATLPCNRNLSKITKITLYSFSELLFVNCLASNYGATTAFQFHVLIESCVFQKLKLS